MAKLTSSVEVSLLSFRVRVVVFTPVSESVVVFTDLTVSK